MQSSLHGDGTPGNNDGLASSCRRFQPSDICSIFNKVVYLCDTQASCIKVFTTLKNTAEFLRGVDLETVISKVSRCLQVIQENERSIREMNISLAQSLNGPQGSVPAKTIGSVKLLEWGLEHLKKNLDEL